MRIRSTVHHVPGPTFPGPPFSLQVVDLNGDGHPDILSGCYSSRKGRPMFGDYHLLAGLRDGTLSVDTLIDGTVARVNDGFFALGLLPKEVAG